MTPKERILALRLLEKQRKNSEMVRRLGIELHIHNADDKRRREGGTPHAE